MNIHENARLTVKGREQMVRRVLAGAPVCAVAACPEVSQNTVRKWVSRYRDEGRAGLMDRPSRPHAFRAPTPETVVHEVIALRKQYLTGRHIACRTGISRATVSRILRRANLCR